MRTGHDIGYIMEIGKQPKMVYALLRRFPMSEIKSLTLTGTAETLLITLYIRQWNLSVRTP